MHPPLEDGGTPATHSPFNSPSSQPAKLLSSPNSQEGLSSLPTKYTTPFIGTSASADVNQLDSSVIPVNDPANAKNKSISGKDPLIRARLLCQSQHQSLEKPAETNMHDPWRTLCGGDGDGNGRACDYPIPFVSFFSFCWLTRESSIDTYPRPQSPLVRPTGSPKYTPTTTNAPPLCPSSLHCSCYRWYPL